MEYKSKITSEELELMDFISFDGVIKVISEIGEDFYQAVKYLKSQSVIGFDTETKPCFIQKVPRNKMAILQLSGADKAFIFRLQQLGLPDKLAKVLANPAVKKIGAAVHDDIRGLQEYRKFEPAAFIDLQRLSGDYGIEEKSVRKMSAIILGKKVSKSQQLSNWESSQLSEAQMRYAATDAWVCKVMYEKLLEEPLQLSEEQIVRKEAERALLEERKAKAKAKQKAKRALKHKRQKSAAAAQQNVMAANE